MELQDSDIEYAERVLLPKGKCFDEERRTFITSLESCDLLAVPGSGKTTALQAKLICLSQHLPLDGNKGILVLSHTNNAVIEIKKRLFVECHKLFEVPHFIGTVQDFVDKFLAIPYYELFYKQKVHVIDAAAYEQEVIRYLNTHRNKAIEALRHKVRFEDLRIHSGSNNDIIITSGIDTLLSLPSFKTWEGCVEEKHEAIRTYIIEMKKHLLCKGVLHYDDCYFLADCYIHKNHFVIDALRKRFQYIFIDETQDLKKYQLDLIDKIFNCDECCIQRIGDKNQSIFHRPDRAMEEQWVLRTNCMTLQNSMRLTNSVAKVVNSFAVDNAPDEAGKPKFVVNGKREIANGDIPPYLILFDKNTKDSLIPTFNSLIDANKLRYIEEGRRYGFHIIGWSLGFKTKEKKGKYRLEDIIPNCRKESEKGSSAYETLSEFIVCGCRDNNMFECKSVVIKILLCVLRKLGRVDENRRYYTKTSMENVFKNRKEYDAYKSFLYDSSVFLHTCQYAECYDAIAKYLQGQFSMLFKITLKNKVLLDFLGKSYNADVVSPMYGDNQDIDVCSVHSSKGQTHCATMYVETSYKGYESEHLFKASKKDVYPNPLFQETHQYSQLITRSAMRMMYVGFSRPTHLLCYAVFKENWNNDRIERMKSLGWEVIVL